ncbi:hypothetical protein HBH95_242630 [Parastagonospora nodorum]|nr:hypothetical protein HBH95_242630 [Parastagonospora nodorum]
MSFDVSLYDTWATLLRGACIQVAPRAVLLDPLALEVSIATHRISVMLTTAAVIHLVAFTYPSALAALRLCIFGGEVTNPATLELIFSKGMRHRRSRMDLAQPIAACSALCIMSRRRTSLAPATAVACIAVDDDNTDNNPVSSSSTITASSNTTVSNTSDSREGELLVSGPGVSRGYYDGDIRTAASFPSINSAAEFNCAATAATAQTTRWYRTGDIVRCSDNDEGGLEFVGRWNNQVKIRGFHAELEAVEAALRGTSLLADAVALKFDVPAAGAGSLLVAFGVPAAVVGDDGSRGGDVAAAAVDKVKLRDSGIDKAETGTAMLNLAEEVTKAVRLLLPDYMVPRLHPSFCYLLCQYNTRF